MFSVPYHCNICLQCIVCMVHSCYGGKVGSITYSIIGSGVRNFTPLVALGLYEAKLSEV